MEGTGYGQEGQARALEEGTSSSGNSTTKVIPKKRWCVYFEDNSGVIVNNKGEMEGSAISGPAA